MMTYIIEGHRYAARSVEAARLAHRRKMAKVAEVGIWRPFDVVEPTPFDINKTMNDAYLARTVYHSK